MNGPHISNLGKKTPSNLRFWANLVLVVATTAGGTLAVSEHPYWGAIVACIAAGARFFVEFYTDEPVNTTKCQD